MVPPNVFIPLAEETGLILGLSEWVLRTACQQMRQWHTQCEHAPQFVSVNISARQFADPSLTAMVAQALCDYDLPGAALELELTESIVMKNGDATHDMLHALKELGVHLAIDDFGTGYSSLSYLKRLPVDVLKVDKSFVDGLGSDTEDTAIVRAIVALAHTLNLEVTGEGIETAAQCHDLEALGCNHGQGYILRSRSPVTQSPHCWRLRWRTTARPFWLCSVVV